MPPKTLTRADLATALHQEIGVSASDCSHFVKEVLNNMETALTNGQEVQISNFGTLVMAPKNTATAKVGAASIDL